MCNNTSRPWPGCTARTGDALKILPSDILADPDYRARFIREADLASGLWHPNIVAVLDRGEHEGQLWITMEYVPCPVSVNLAVIASNLAVDGSNQNSRSTYRS